MKGTRICKVCGKEYPYCKTNKPTGVFRYQDVACCPEHGEIYFKRVLEARANKTVGSENTEDTEQTAAERIEYTIGGAEEDVSAAEETPDDTEEIVLEFETEEISASDTDYEEE